ncbi:MAG: RNA-guided pseudouridylation complex pseudouridine synthase subunit Cbf5 [Candidatus Lokiarchaeota archaeon]|nr:RNA-guided pseudouridylation complex pseudouridine synthase subunit Cbf5 [Candidatus Lokiarchaeota archaeon]
MERRILPADESKEWIIKAEEETDFKYGCKPEDRRPLSHYINYGIVNLDKPMGPTSHEVVVWVKNVLQLEKTGHGGTLDPKVTGVLPVALGEATKVTSALLNAGKEYVCVIKFHQELDLEKIKGLMNTFTTVIWQRPPVKSAVARVLRKRRIYYIDILETVGKYTVFRVGCEAGTYIRKLCFDLGEVALCGANMAELRRTRAGLFTEDSVVTLQDLNDAFYISTEEGDDSYLYKLIQPMEKAVEHMQKIIVRDTAVDALCHGANLAANGVLKIHADIKKGDHVAIMTQKGELVAFGETFHSAIKIAKLSSGFVAKIERVAMPRRTYPHWKTT